VGKSFSKFNLTDKLDKAKVNSFAGQYTNCGAVAGFRSFSELKVWAIS